MKKLWVGMISLVLLLGLCACGQQDPQEEACYVEPAQLSEEERRMADLLGDPVSGSLFDFVTDGTLSGYSVQIYRLEDGAWKPWREGSDSAISGSLSAGEAQTGGKNRILVELDGRTGQVKITLQDGGGTSKYESQEEILQDRSGMAIATASLSQRTAIQAGREIPLLIQVVTGKNEVRSGDPESDFAQPENLAGYEAVYAVTLLLQS